MQAPPAAPAPAGSAPARQPGRSRSGGCTPAHVVVPVTTRCQHPAAPLPGVAPRCAGAAAPRPAAGRVAAVAAFRPVPAAGPWPPPRGPRPVHRPAIAAPAAVSPDRPAAAHRARRARPGSPGSARAGSGARCWRAPRRANRSPQSRC
ncbi:hypothetical protein G6F35_015242 [Rhizopus arrhizus]|nr:hypothetical protein G6F35_015242 [Rhizopus arrhizus]